MTIKMYKSYWRSVSKALLAVILLSSFVCNGLQAAASDDLWPQLRAAAQVGNLDKVERLVELGAGMTPLHWAALKGQLDVVKYLVEQLSSPFALQDTQDTSLQLRWSGGADTRSSLRSSSFAGQASRAQVINAEDEEVWTPLHYAAYEGLLDVVECLVRMGANLNAQDKKGYTPLHLATLKGHLPVVQYLVDTGAKLSAKNTYGKTPLDIATGHGYQEIVEYLRGV